MECPPKKSQIAQHLEALENASECVSHVVESFKKHGYSITKRGRSLLREKLVQARLNGSQNSASEKAAEEFVDHVVRNIPDSRKVGVSVIEHTIDSLSRKNGVWPFFGG